MTDHTDAFLQRLRADQDARWLAGERPTIESYIERWPALKDAPEDILVLVAGELMNRTQRGETICEQDYARRFPQLAQQLRQLLEVHELLVWEELLEMPVEPSLSAWSSPAGYGRMTPRGRGGICTVYQAEHLATGEQVALKCLHPERRDDPHALVRLLQEGEILSRCAHPNVVRWVATGQHQGQPFLAIEWLPGGTLSDRLKAGPLSLSSTRELMRSLVEALDYIHERGIVHRDLKPGNILYSATGRPTLIDFGIARLLHAAGGCTATGQLIGTLNYMPPEQVQGQHDRIGPAADIYSLGAILYHALAGHPPFRTRKPMDLLPLIIEQSPAAPEVSAPLPEAWATICLACLEKDPARRPTIPALRKAFSG